MLSVHFQVPFLHFFFFFTRRLRKKYFVKIFAPRCDKILSTLANFYFFFRRLNLVDLLLHSTCQAFLSFSSSFSAFFFYKGMQKKIKKEVFRENFATLRWNFIDFDQFSIPRVKRFCHFQVSLLRSFFSFTRACERRLRKKYFVKFFVTLRQNFIDFGQILISTRVNDLSSSKRRS